MKTKQITEQDIKGFDYSEIEVLFNDLDFFQLDNEVSQRKVKLIRLFVKKLLDNAKERGDYKTQIINGLHETQDDFTFTQWAYQMKDGLWL